MTIGIYSLYWEEQDLIYIGQSVEIETRYKKHLSTMLANKHSNYKVQDAFNKYGLPIHFIIEECPIEQLNNSELMWQKEFNSLASLDITEAGYSGGSGLNGGNSKYSKLQILQVANTSSISYVIFNDLTL